MRRLAVSALAAALMWGADAQAQRPAPAGVPHGAPAPLATTPARPPEFRLRVEPRATEVLKATAAKLAGAKAMSFTAVVGYEFPSQLGPAIQYNVRYDVAMNRAAGLKVVIPGDGPASEFMYDGRAMMAYVPGEDLLAVADAPGNLDEALQAAFDLAGIYFPFGDLLVADPYAVMTQGVNVAFYIGPSNVVGGVKTEMVAIANNDVFIQMWIGAEDKLPRRMRAVFSQDPLRLRHDMELSNWQIEPGQLDVAPSAQARAGKRIPFAHPAQPPAAAAAKP